MLGFWKRSNIKEKGRSSSNSSQELVNGCEIISVNCADLLQSFEDDVFNGVCENNGVNGQNSRLSLNLQQVLVDKAALAYFIQYLEVNGGLRFVRCWIDIENFRTAALINDNCGQNHEDNLVEIRNFSPILSSKVDHDSLSVSTDCDSITADTNSLCDYSSITISDKNEVIRIEKSDCDLNTSDISDKNHKLSVKPPNINEKKIGDKVFQDLLEDALRLFKKYVAHEAQNSVECSEELRNSVIEGICSEQCYLDPHCFDRVQKFVFEKMETFFTKFFQSHYHCKFQIDVLTSGNITLQDILYNESILFYFMEFLEQEYSRNLLEFWLAAINFRKQLMTEQNLDTEEAQKDAVVLYDKYFSLQATSPLGFGDKIRFLIEENICREGGPLPNCFNHPIKIIEHILNKYYLKNFLSSQLYFKYLSELISTVQTNGVCNDNIRKSTQSDCSSEISISVQNTLLAMGETHRKHRKTDMNIDTRQLYDPDSLWKRNRKNRRLCFGRINEMGRFVTDLEPISDKKTESKLAKAMKRFINLEENKTKEEMAWQVAEMIVKDITSITLAPTKSQS